MSADIATFSDDDLDDAALDELVAGLAEDEDELPAAALPSASEPPAKRLRTETAALEEDTGNQKDENSPVKPSFSQRMALARESIRVRQEEQGILLSRSGKSRRILAERERAQKESESRRKSLLQRLSASSPEQETAALETDNASVERLSGLRVAKRVLSSQVIDDMKHEWKYRALRALESMKTPAPNSESPWMTVAVLAKKSETRQSSRGEAFSVWTLTDLAENSLSLFLFGEAHQSLWRAPDLCAYAIIDPGTFSSNDRSGMALRVTRSNQIRKIGRAVDAIQCRGMRKDAARCTMIIDARGGDYCSFHLSSALTRQVSTRMEMNAPGAVSRRRQEPVLGGRQLSRGTFRAGGVAVGPSGMPLSKAVPSRIAKVKSEHLERLVRERGSIGARALLAVKNPAQPKADPSRVPSNRHGPSKHSPSSATDSSGSSSGLRTVAATNAPAARQRGGAAALASGNGTEKISRPPTHLPRPPLPAPAAPQHVLPPGSSIRGNAPLLRAGVGEGAAVLAGGRFSRPPTHPPRAPPPPPPSTRPMLARGIAPGSGIDLSASVLPGSARGKALAKALSVVRQKGGLRAVDPNDTAASTRAETKGLSKEAIARARARILARKHAAAEAVEPAAAPTRAKSAAQLARDRDAPAAQPGSSSLVVTENPMKPTSASSFLAAFTEPAASVSGGIDAARYAKSQFDDAAEAEERADREARFNELEKRDMVAQKAASVTSLSVKIYVCKPCRYAGEGLPACSHPYEQRTVVKRFFRCAKCGWRTVTLRRGIVALPCEKCGATRFEPASAYRSVEGKSAAPERLMLRGEEFSRSLRYDL